MSSLTLFQSAGTHGLCGKYRAKVVSIGALNPPDACLRFQKGDSPSHPLPSPLVINSRLRSGMLSRRRLGPTFPHSGLFARTLRHFSTKSKGQQSEGIRSESVTT